MNPAIDTGIWGILMGALGGAVVGMEREWSGHTREPESRFAGFRTFTLLGGLAATAGFLWTRGYESLALLLAAGAIGLIVAAYALIARRDPDATTAVAALVVMAAGILAGVGMWALASGIVIVTAVLLLEKSRLHSWVTGISDVGLRAGVRFALMAIVILPLLPEGPFGPRGSVRPRELWILVLFFSGISFAAYVIRARLGPRQGYVWAGALGGLISSTNVSLSFSRLSRSEKGSGLQLGVGVIAACTMLYFRVGITASVLNPALGAAVLPYLIAPALVGAAMTWYGMRQPVKGTTASDEPGNPLELKSALQMAALFQVVLFLMAAVRERMGDAGLLVSGAVLGLTDMDALVISMARGAPILAEVVGTGTAVAEPMQSAAAATVVGILSNTALKLVLAATIGQGTCRCIVVGGLLTLGIVTALPLFLLTSG